MPVPEVRVWDTCFEFLEDWNFWSILKVYGEAGKYCGGTMTSSGNPSAPGALENVCGLVAPTFQAGPCTFSTL